MGILQIFDLYYPVISGSQLDPFRTLSLNKFAMRKQTTTIDIDVLKTRGNNLKS